MSPRYSIVIPTCRRANLVASALRSALVQPEPDIEILLSNNGGDPATNEVLGGYDDPRLRIVQAPSLRMPEHWAFAIGQARGEYVLMLCDDDALLPGTLAVVDRVLARHEVDVVCWRLCWHFSRDWFVPAERGRVGFGPPFTDRAWRIDAEMLIESAFAARVFHSQFIPRMMNAAVRADALRRAAASGPSPFRPICPDYSSMLALATHARGMVMLDAPLYVGGATPQSIGASSLRQEAAGRRFVEEMEVDGDPARCWPGLVTTGGLIARTFDRCRQEFADIADQRLDPVNVYAAVGRELRDLDPAAAHTAPLRAEFDAAVAALPAAQAEAIREAVERGREAQCEHFLLGPVDDVPVTGIGPFHVPASDDRRIDADTIDAVARELPSYLRRQARSLAGLGADLARWCGERRPVLFGLGRNGRAAARLLESSGHAIAGRLLGLDERIDAGVSGLPLERSAAALSPGRHFVLITPDHSDGIARRLEALGFRPQRDYRILAQCGRSLELTAGAA